MDGDVEFAALHTAQDGGEDVAIRDETIEKVIRFGNMVLENIKMVYYGIF